MTIIDCCTFFNELDVLEIRFTELDPVVDRFVIVEATLTHAGDPKPLHFEANKARFAPWLHKIRHIIVHDLPSGGGIAGTRRREMAQRNAILRGLWDAAPDDIVLISDADEIPRCSRIVTALEPGDVLTYDQTLHYYNVNTIATDLRWRGTRAAQAADVQALSPHVIRYGLGTPDSLYPRYGLVPDGGWHYSYFGDSAHVATKLRSFLHQELVDDAALDPATIVQRMAIGADVFGRAEQQFTRCSAIDRPVALRHAPDPSRWQHLYAPGWAPQYHEDWYSGAQADALAELAAAAPVGAHIEIGCWEGRSTIAIANAIAPRTLTAVDTWAGNIAEGADHPSVTAAASRDVFQTFRANCHNLTAGNVLPVRSDWRDWIDGWDAPIAFAHLDAAHDRASVADCLARLAPFLAPGGILCGDDYYADGVQQGVADVFGAPTVVYGGRLWVVRYGD